VPGFQGKKVTFDPNRFKNSGGKIQIVEPTARRTNMTYDAAADQPITIEKNPKEPEEA
jgi:hypothetical protein